MELWNDFEGKLLDGQYVLGQLLSPKGRSAFFRTTMADGSPATVRVIESLNDEDEILSRWNAVRAMREPHLVAIRACGKTVLDGTHLVYALLEPTDAELSEVLRERALTTDETRQMAAAVLDGLKALHRGGLVHEHVDATSVWASGETVKLRSDCIREAPEGAEGEVLRRRDAHDLAMLIGVALTQRRDAAQVKLPRPFDDLLRNGMSGVWGLEEMGTLLRPVAPVLAAGRPGGAGTARAGAPAAGAESAGRRVGPSLVPAAGGRVTAALAGPAAQGKAAGSALPAGPGGGNGRGVGLATGVTGGTAAAARAVRSAAGAGPVAGGEDTSPAAVAARLAAVTVEGGPELRGTLRRPEASDRLVMETEPAERGRWTLWAGVGAAVLLVLALLWHFGRGGGPNPQAASTTAARAADAGPATVASAPAARVTSKPSAATPGTGHGRTMRPAVTVATSQPLPVPVASAAAMAGGAQQWRVVAFTYRREEQAQHKVETVAREHPELRPEVFSPRGGAPYLVALGGWMSAEQAASVRDRARREGLPRDTYTQNYRGH